MYSSSVSNCAIFGSGGNGTGAGATATAFDEREITNARRIDLGSGLYTTAPAIVPPYAQAIAQGGFENGPLAGSRESGLDPVLPAEPSPAPAQGVTAENGGGACAGGACAAGGGKSWTKYAMWIFIVALVLALMLGGAWWLKQRSG